MSRAMDTSIWKRFHLRPTACRMDVLHCLIGRKVALSEREIREATGNDYDRTTFYRTMKSLEEAGLIHRIVADQGVVKYAACSLQAEQHAHAHFLCKRCGNVWCLAGCVELHLQVPEGFMAEEEAVIVRGLCQACQS